MGSLFNMDNKFFQAMSQLVDTFFLSMLWMLFCIPVFTIGASTTALHYTVHKVLRGHRGYLWQSFWGAFKSNFGQATKMWLIQLALLVLMFADQRVTKNLLMNRSAYGVMYYFFLIVMLMILVWVVYCCAYTARFELGMKQTMKNAALIAIAHLPWSGLILLLLLVSAALITFLSPMFIAILPAGVGYIYDLILERIFRKYMTEEDLKREEALEMEDRKFD